ncbi:hypothetical protein B0T26DRAFT_714249 [Lasiosphaeria miniovina]|uniref:Secreted protein n=1 Tax=Lasiosphaeria miniovina TaxID=1954250 RepID=A0AA40DUL6_9PEZI|nr:uncharacterized protein B0T26DRAFT_714249 [Lasiosphaeria miniovina]KAK0712413.1 hypothetical protein B0T26DRAFT_714249 [Lasiosphaeria miniovina]
MQPPGARERVLLLVLQLLLLLIKQAWKQASKQATQHYIECACCRFEQRQRTPTELPRAATGRPQKYLTYIPRPCQAASQLASQTSGAAMHNGIVAYIPSTYPVSRQTANWARLPRTRGRPDVDDLAPGVPTITTPCCCPSAPGAASSSKGSATRNVFPDPS